MFEIKMFDKLFRLDVPPAKLIELIWPPLIFSVSKTESFTIGPRIAV